jgi:peptidoglycan hydrolase-like protein with peptidoglycan-binding domain
MLKGLFACACLLLILSPSASAQSADDFVFENLCAPDVSDGLYTETTFIALDNSQVERLRIELLERGFDPGFDPDAVDADEQLAQAIRGFQAEFSLPVTGQLDAATLSLLNIPI